MHARSKGLILICCVWLYYIESPRVFAIPPPPAVNGVGFFVQDYAGLFEHAEHSLEEIKDLQKQAFELHSTPIIIVTIDTMKPYGYHPNDFEHMATQWFNKWEIGMEKINGKNQGILILLTKQERKCRIELGADWGRMFDDHCQNIMKYSMIPYFKSGDYASGLQKGTERLLALASSGPAASPPAAWSFNPAIIFFGIFGLAILTMIIALTWRERDSTVGFFAIIAGLGFIAGCVLMPLLFLPVLLYIVIPGIFIYLVFRILTGKDIGSDYTATANPWQQLKSNVTSWSFWYNLLLRFLRALASSRGSSSGSSGSSWGGGGGGYSGGGFSGGSSGGGGATGSW